jgi:hypothetical protein
MGDSEAVSPIELAILGRIISDNDGDGALSLANYQAIYPGHEAVIAAAYAKFTAASDKPRHLPQQHANSQFSRMPVTPPSPTPLPE